MKTMRNNRHQNTNLPVASAYTYTLSLLVLLGAISPSTATATYPTLMTYEVYAEANMPAGVEFVCNGLKKTGNAVVNGQKLGTSCRFGDASVATLRPTDAIRYINIKYINSSKETVVSPAGARADAQGYYGYFVILLPINLSSLLQATYVSTVRLTSAYELKTQPTGYLEMKWKGTDYTQSYAPCVGMWNTAGTPSISMAYTASYLMSGPTANATCAGVPVARAPYLAASSTPINFGTVGVGTAPITKTSTINVTDSFATRWYGTVVEASWDCEIDGGGGCTKKYPGGASLTVALKRAQNSICTGSVAPAPNTTTCYQNQSGTHVYYLDATLVPGASGETINENIVININYT